MTYRDTEGRAKSILDEGNTGRAKSILDEGNMGLGAGDSIYLYIDLGLLPLNARWGCGLDLMAGRECLITRSTPSKEYSCGY